MSDQPDEQPLVSFASGPPPVEAVIQDHLAQALYLCDKENINPIRMWKKVLVEYWSSDKP